MDEEQIKEAIINSSLPEEYYTYTFHDGASILHYAALYNNLNLIQKLAGIGFNLDSKGGKYQSTPLFYALYNSNYRVMKYLIINGADINYVNTSGYSLLHTCISYYDTLGFILLMANNVNMNIKDHKKRSVAEYAGQKKRKEIIFALNRFYKKNEKYFPQKSTKYLILFFIVYSIFFKENIFFLFIVSILIKNVVYKTDIMFFINLFYTILFSSQLLERNRWFVVLLIPFIYLKYLLLFTKPKYLMKNDINKCKEIISNILETTELTKKIFCYTCWIKKDKGIKHCSVCNICIVYHDHHCPCLNRCIQNQSDKLFEMYLLVCLILLYFLYSHEIFNDYNFEIRFIIIFIFGILSLRITKMVCNRFTNK
ncbi:palmitoyltransferase [Hamiltosporidium magnivora]|uniref:Palmitoyltransferase n=1 Tax=Hamiltosporidium magnivora TaxID=148818 RepID=A0A4Q9L7D4_9MICR|nr:palmitoyltransferase [Hamiltosporidium magnivora]